MARDDKDYFRRRAETEAAMAASAPTVEAARVHETLARYYRGIIDAGEKEASVASAQREQRDHNANLQSFRGYGPTPMFRF